MTKDEAKVDVMFLGSLVLFFYGIYKVGQLSSNIETQNVSMGVRG